MSLAYFQVYGLDGAYWTLLVSVHCHSHHTSTQTPKGLRAFMNQEIASYSQAHRMVQKYKTNQQQVYFVLKSIMGMRFSSDLEDQIHTAWALVKISCTSLAERTQVSTRVLRLSKDHLDFYILFTVTSRLVRKHFNQMCEISPLNPINVDRQFSQLNYTIQGFMQTFHFLVETGNNHLNGEVGKNFE